MSNSEPEEEKVTAEEALEVVERIRKKFQENGVKKIKLTSEGWREEEDSLPAQSRSSSSYPKTSHPPRYKSPVETEKEKFGSKEQKQLELFIDKDVEKEIEERQVEVTGLDFNVSQGKAFEALQKLLAETNYQGDTEAPEVTTYREERGGTYTLPGIFIKWSDYYEAYGLKRDKSGKYTNRRQVKKAKEALKDLAQPWRITVEDKTEGHKVARETPLIKLTWEYEGAPDETQTQDKRLLIRYKPLFIDKIDRDNEGRGFYLFKPYNLHEEINKAVGGSRYSSAIPRFIWWLNSIDYEAKHNEDYDYTRDPFRIGKELLAYKLRLRNYVERRQWNYVDERVEQACEVATEINFLLEYEIGEEMVRLWLNPHRCSRLRYRLEQQDKYDPKLSYDRD